MLSIVRYLPGRVFLVATYSARIVEALANCYLAVICKAADAVLDLAFLQCFVKNSCFEPQVLAVFKRCRNIAMTNLGRSELIIEHSLDSQHSHMLDRRVKPMCFTNAEQPTYKKQYKVSFGASPSE